LAKGTASAEMPEQEDVAEVMDVLETKEVPVEVAEESLEVEEVLDIADDFGSCFLFILPVL
jgi:hypothetical protein